MSSESNAPFITLGRHLKYVREQAQQSLSEVSGAVEIEEESLQRIEAGCERPEEEILLLLINHFGVQDRDALRLWELAGYESEVPDQLKADGELPAGQKQIMLLLGVDMRTIYSDGLDITVTPGGLTLSFTQTGGERNMPVARVGMSYEQAEQVLTTLQQAILKGRYLRGPRALPPSID